MEQKYRMLEVGEALIEGDEVRNGGEWRTIHPDSAGAKVRNADGGAYPVGYYRRPVAAAPRFTGTITLSPSSTETTIEVREAWQKDHMEMKRKLDAVKQELEVLTKHWYDQRAELADAKNQITDLQRERDNWQETAAQHLRNQQFYHGLVTDIGNMFGLKARISDYGTICQDVLALRVPELVAELIVEHS